MHALPGSSDVLTDGTGGRTWMWGALRGVALPGVLLLALSGCAGGADEEPPAGTTASAEPTEETDDGAADDTETEEPSAEADDAGEDDAAGDDGGAVMAGTTDLGEVLVDAEGMTLYVFDPDAQGASTCYDACATAWPPLIAEGQPAAGDGADDAMLGTVERTDGAQQVTYDGWPLYSFADDAAAGDVNGQGLNDKWWVVTPAGEPVKD
ncbi:MAG: hypothetical protein JWP95_1588 [Actinotalea sp.]|nr:hypothetical protein [Actinotalea sp.]